MYKHFFYLLTMAAVLFGACSASENDRTVGTDVIDIPSSADGTDEKSLAEITFEQTEFSTGRILQGDVATFTFVFENTGKAPLIISDVSASCGCTVPRNYPKGKIMPGEGGEIEVEYDSQSKWGQQVSVIAISTNTRPPRTELIIRSDVVAPNKP